MKVCGDGLGVLSLLFVSIPPNTLGKILREDFAFGTKIPIPTRRLFIYEEQNPDTRTSLVCSKKSNTSPTVVYTTTVLKKRYG
jgi:hypothetical protein